ncbi:type I-B CRISPR-associated protein Cas5b [Candidatus Caldatribacterium sp. SIUC1]|uniref:type I-B CRISPR-associated protein Cas5b n=1 Tax=Candidatus Caldatribacterium sp. SIUC1 TaxID=3418365 RepID=UPI003F68F53C
MSDKRKGFEVLRLIIYQPQAHYRIPFTYQRRHTYPLPSYSAVRGFLGNILGIRGDTFGENPNPEKNGDFRNLKNLKIGVCGRFEAKTTECTWLRNLSKTEHIKAFGAVENRVRFGVGEHPGGQAPVLIDVLNEVRIVVYLAHEDSSFLEKLFQKIQNPVGRLYPLYLGRAEDWVIVEEIKKVPLEVKSKDAHFEHFFWVPERPWPPDIPFDFAKVQGLRYRVPIFWELRDGSRDFRYVSAKLNDGRFQGVSFLFDASFGKKGLPVFLASMEGINGV